jgi:hypothetical protein
VAVDVLRIRSVDDVVLTFMEPERLPSEADLQRWYAALEHPIVKKALVMSVGPVASDPARRRVTVELFRRRGLRLVAISDHRLNRGLVGLFGWLGVPVTAYSWPQLEDAARDVATQPELVAPIVRAALAMRAESPAAVGLGPDEG